MQELDPQELLEQADASGRVYPIKAGWRRFFFVGGFLMVLLVLTLPAGIWFFVVGRRARVGLTDEGFVVSWFFTKAYAWSDVTSLSTQRLNMSASGQGGLVGALVTAAANEAIVRKTQGLNGPLMFTVAGKKMPLNIQAHAVENSMQLAQEMARHTGLEVKGLPVEPTAANDFTAPSVRT